MKLSEILRAGKANIEAQGWCQGDDLAIMGDRSTGSYPRCAATAMSDFDDPDQEAINKAATFFRKLICEEQNIGSWNDAPERTLADVLAAYDKAITAAEAQEAAGV